MRTPPHEQALEPYWHRPAHAHLVWIGIGLIAGDGALIVIGIALLYFGPRRREQPVISS